MCIMKNAKNVAMQGGHEFTTNTCTLHVDMVPCRAFDSWKFKNKTHIYRKKVRDIFGVLLKGKKPRYTIIYTKEKILEKNGKCVL